MEKKGKLWHRIIFALYIAVLCYFLFFAEMFGRTEGGQEYHYNLILFKEIRRFWENRHILGFWPVFYNIAGNVLGFVPYGFYLPVLFAGVRGNGKSRRFGVLRVLLLSLLLSLFVETMQLAFKVGSFDVDDLLLNTLGGILGYIIYVTGMCYRKQHSGKEGHHCEGT